MCDGRVSVIVYVFNPLWKWSKLGMVEIKFLAYVLIVTRLSAIMLIMLYINVVYFITCIVFFQYAVGGIFGIVLHGCTLWHKEGGRKLFRL